MMAPILRNLARYGLGVCLGMLVSRGVISEELANHISADPELQAAIQYGAVAAGMAATEFLYGLAKRFGWTT